MTTHDTTSASESSWQDNEFSSLLYPGGQGASEHNPDTAITEADGFPINGVIDAVHATARARSEAIRGRSADLARAVLVSAEEEVRDVQRQELPAADEAEQSRGIVARAQREVSVILAKGRNEAEVVAMRAGQRAVNLRAQADSLTADHLGSDDVDQAITRPELGVWQHEGRADGLLDDEQLLVSAHAILAEGPSTTATDHYFASLRATPLPADEGGLRYRVSGKLTLATMLAFQHAVSRLPGVNSATVEPEPNDVAVLSMTTNDSNLVQRLLSRTPGIYLQIDPA